MMDNKALIRGILYGWVAVWAVAVWVFFQYEYEFSFFYKEQNQIFLLSWDYIAEYLNRPAWAANLCGDFITQFFYYLYVGPVVWVGLLLIAGDLVKRFLLRLMLWMGGRRKLWMDVLSFGVAMALMSVLAVFSFDPDYRTASVISVLGVIVLLYIWTLFLRCRMWVVISVACISVVLAGWMFDFGKPGVGRFSAPHYDIEDYLAADNLYYFGRYDELAERVLQMDKVTPIVSCYYYMAMAQKGMLPQSMGNVQPVDLGTLIHIGPSSNIQEMKLMNEFYFLLGDMTLAERAALLGCVSSPNNRNVRMIKRLAEVNLVKGDNEAAMKYLRILDKTWVYRKWAADNRPGRMSFKLQNKQAFVCREDTLRLGDNCRNVLLGLLEANPENRVALDYLLCTDILVKQMDVFYHDYMKYYHPLYGDKKEPLYQQILGMWKEKEDVND